MNKLKPCPFCGGNAELSYDDGFESQDVKLYSDSYCITCLKCFVYIDSFNKKDIINHWNTRYDVSLDEFMRSWKDE